MKKFTVVIMVAAVVIVALGAVGVAYAQSANQGAGTGLGAGSNSGRGARGAMGTNPIAADEEILHDYLITIYAEALNLPVADLEARLEQGETMAQIALSTGLSIDEFRTLMVAARTQAIEQAVADGILTQEQAEWINQRGAGQMAGGQMSYGRGMQGTGQMTGGQMGNGRGMQGAGQGQFATQDCPYYDQTNP